jgi:hypothetical protein
MDTFDLGDPVVLTVTVDPVANTAELVTVDPDGVTAQRTPDSTGTGFTVTVHPDLAGLWRYRWTISGPDQDGEEGSFTVLDRLGAPRPAWTPTPEQVAAHIPTRGPFDRTSRPTRHQVTDLAVQVARGLTLEVGEDRLLTPVQLDVARSYTEHATAARVEFGWFPEQQDRDGAGAQQDLWAGQELVRLRRALGLEASMASADAYWSGSVPLMRAGR